MHFSGRMAIDPLQDIHQPGVTDRSD